ncbi:MAG: polysaccharide biosynthesis C-terminal domain-containing protein, partial [Oscillospiraceae bacterium]|nr:polysaccharide biosynthesis C-terminal domain-containing protein [Oscillospiraceae bacterium]
EGLDLAATLDYAMDYMKVILLQMLPFALLQVYAGTLRETGEAVLPMKAGIVAVLVNLVFNYILIFGKFGFPAMGVTGAAIATVMARVVELLIVAIWTHRNKHLHRFIEGVYSSLRVPLSLVKQTVLLGLPLLVNELLWSSGMTMLNQCYSVRGLEVVSACNISTTVSNLFFCAFFAMGTTVSIVVGQLLGAGELERAVDEDRKLIAFSAALCVCTGALMALLAPMIPNIYNTTPVVKSIASRMLVVSAVMMPVMAVTNTSYFTLRSGGKTILAFVFDSVFVWVVAVPVAFVLSRFTSLPILPMFIVVQSLELIKMVLGIWFVRSRRWVENLVSK